jgi:uncharacterized delta-60 repeat protein
MRKLSFEPWRVVVPLIALVLQPVWHARAWVPVSNLDPTFGNAGVVTIDFNGSTDRASSLAIQRDGKVIVGGFAYAGASSLETFVDEFALVRLNADGTLDSSFGSGGKATTAFGGLTNEITGVAIQDDGKIVAVGFVQTLGRGYDFGLARFNSDGTLDPSFGSGGRLSRTYPQLPIFPGLPILPIASFCSLTAR